MCKRKHAFRAKQELVEEKKKLIILGGNTRFHLINQILLVLQVTTNVGYLIHRGWMIVIFQIFKSILFFAN